MLHRGHMLARATFDTTGPNRSPVHPPAPLRVARVRMADCMRTVLAHPTIAGDPVRGARAPLSRGPGGGLLPSTNHIGRIHPLPELSRFGMVWGACAGLIRCGRFTVSWGVSSVLPPCATHGPNLPNMSQNVHVSRFDPINVVSAALSVSFRSRGIVTYVTIPGHHHIVNITQRHHPIT